MDKEIFRMPGHLISRSSRLMLRFGEERFQQLGLSMAQMPVLAALRNGVPMTQKELATLANIEQPTMAQLLDRMERDGLIVRTSNPDDKRSSLVSLTPIALERLPAAREVLLEGNKLALQDFSEDEGELLCQLLRRLIKNFDPNAIGIDPEPPDCGAVPGNPTA